MKTKIIIRSDKQRQRAHELVDEVPEGYEVLFQKHKDKKTLEQLAYTFGVIYPAMIRKLEESGTGDTFTVEEMHDYMKRKIIGPVHKEICGEVKEFTPELKKSDRKAWSEYIDSLIRFCWNRLEIAIPAPEWREDG